MKVGPVGEVNERDLPLRARKKLQTRQEIHLAAIELAIEHGPSRVTADDIAQRARVSTRTFFNYFATKEDAFIGASADEAERVADELRARPATESITDSLHAIYRQRLTASSAQVELWRMRRELAAKYPELGRAMLGVTGTIERRLVVAAVERAGAEDPDVVYEVFAAMAAVRTALWLHNAAGLHGDLIGRLDASFERLLSARSRP